MASSSVEAPVSDWNQQEYDEYISSTEQELENERAENARLHDVIDQLRTELIHARIQAMNGQVCHIQPREKS